MEEVGDATGPPYSDLERVPEDPNLIHPPPNLPPAPLLVSPSATPSFDPERGSKDLIHVHPPPHLPPRPLQVPRASTTNAVPTPDHDPTQPEWLTLIMTSSFAAISISIQSLSTTTPPPISLHLAGLGLVLALAFIVISKYIPAAELGRGVKQKLENTGVFFGFTSFLMAITLSFPLWLKFISWAIYTIALLTIFYFQFRNFSFNTIPKM